MYKISLDMYDILKVNQTRDGVIITQEAYENCVYSVINAPIIGGYIAIGVVISLTEGIIFADINYKIVGIDYEIEITESMESNGVMEITSMIISALHINKRK